FLWGSDPAPFGGRATAPGERTPSGRAVRTGEPAELPGQQPKAISGPLATSVDGAIALALAARTASSSSAQDFVIPAGPQVGQQVMANVSDRGVIEVGGTVRTSTSIAAAVGMQNDNQILENAGTIATSGNAADGILSNGNNAAI